MKKLNTTNNSQINDMNIIITKNDYKDINLDTRMLPLFKTPVILKKLSDRKKNKYKFTIKNDNKNNIRFKIIPFKDILNIFLKGINLYNNQLNNYLEKHTNKELILELKSDENYKFNTILSNYIYILNKFFPIFYFRSLIYNYSLFLPKRLFRPHPNIKFKYRFKYLEKYYKIDLNYNNKRDIKINKRQINKLLEIGGKILTELDNQIALKKIFITKLKNNNNILNIINSFLTIVKEDNNNNYNNNNTNTNNNNINNMINPYLKNSSITFLDDNNNTNITGKDSYSLDKKFKLNDKKKIEDSFEEVKDNNNELIKYENKFIIKKIFNMININKTNENKIEQTLNNIFKFNKVEFKNDDISFFDNPIEMLYTKFNKYKNKHFLNNNKNQYKYNNNYNSKLSNILEQKPIINQYLKSMSSYNMIQKGIIMSYSNIIGFNFNTDRNKLITNIYKFLAASFKSMYCLISKPVFVMTPDKIIIQLFYFLLIPNILKFKKIFKYKYRYKNGNRYRIKSSLWFERKLYIKKNFRKFKKKKINVRIKLRKLSNIVITKIFYEKFKILCHILSRLFKKPVQLDLIRLHYPYNDSNILVNLLGIMINKIKLRIIFRKLFEKAIIKNLNKVTGKKNYNFNIIPAFLSGIKIRVAGRLLTHRVVPRKTVKTIQRGASARGKINFSDMARYTKKNKRGAFSITVSTGQNLF
jgi:Mitochondrial ribosomal protein (VAR1)